MNVVRSRSWKRLGWTIMALAALVFSGSLSRADDEPATRPAADAAKPARRPRAIFTMAEWNDMMTFLYANSPNRAQVLDKLNLPDSAPIKQELIRKWRAYNFVKEHFPKLAELHIQRYHLEDDIFGYVIEARTDPGRRPEIRKQVRTRVAALVQLSMQERQMRIDRLQEMLTEEKLKLASEEDHKTENINERMRKVFRNLDPESMVTPQDPPVQADAEVDQPEDAQLQAVVAMVIDSASLTEGIDDSVLN